MKGNLVMIYIIIHHRGVNIFNVAAYSNRESAELRAYQLTKEDGFAKYVVEEMAVVSNEDVAKKETKPAQPLA